MSAKVTEPVQARSRRTAERVLKAAVDLIAERGINGFAMTAVAERAGVSIGGVYGRYPDKDALLHAVKSRVLDELQATVQSALDDAPDAVDAVVRAYTGTISSSLFDNPRLYAFIFVHSADKADLKGLGFSFHDAIRTAYVRKLSGAGVTDQDALAATYEMIVQSLLMRVISVGHSEPTTPLYEGFPDPEKYATTMAGYISTILRGGNAAPPGRPTAPSRTRKPSKSDGKKGRQ